jgi:large subunit ribosomal protein L29
MKYSAIKELSTAEIAERIKEEKTQLTKLRFTHAVSAIESPAQLRETRKTIARLFTELTVRARANENGNNQ